MRRRPFLAACAAAALPACAATQPPPPPLIRLPGGPSLVLSPTADFDPARLPAGWSRRGVAGAGMRTGMEAGRPILSFDAPGGDSLARALDQPLSTTPHLSWWWKLEPDAFAGGPGDGLRRGLRIVVGFDGGGPTDLIQPSRWMRDDAGFPPHHRRIEITLSGTGAARPELALVELVAVADGGAPRALRAAAPGLTGGWIAERADLRSLYRDAFPADRLGAVRIVFVALGALPARLPADAPHGIGHIVEVQLSP